MLNSVHIYAECSSTLYPVILSGESPWTNPNMDNRIVDRFVSEDFDTDSESDTEGDEDNKKVDTSKIQMMTVQ